ncbi:HD-GYP domain-containing protein [Thermatribacter velox]|uniref:HD-GYP domain-containing protein n=1 Tax=Thermatribacter velox TaxID=3039681 RepID=A0ABZ2YFU1_9BACT
MLKIHVSRLRPGMVTAYPILHENGVILVKEDIVLTEKLINKLKELNFDYIYIKDERFKNVDPEEILSQETKRKVLQTVHETFYKVIKGKEKSIQPLKEAVNSIIEEVLSSRKSVISLVQLRKHDDSVFAHSVNVATLSAFIGKFFKLPAETLHTLALGSLMHDLGKIKVPLEILNKPGKLDAEDWEIIKQHPGWAAELMLERIPENATAIKIALQHHERMNGSGYPYGLAGEEIHLLSRICACADVYDALTVDRPYRKRFSYSEALEYLMGNAGRLFDLQVVTTMVRHIAPYPVGETVKLSTGEIAVVIKLNEGLPIRPVVRVIKDREGRELETPKDLDLMSELTVSIVESVEASSKATLDETRLWEEAITHDPSQG